MSPATIVGAIQNNEAPWIWAKVKMIKYLPKGYRFLGAFYFIVKIAVI
jgi:hypothetical protein